MIRLIGFESKCGKFTSDTTGEVIDWSNRTFHCVTDEGLSDKERGLKVFDQKLKTEFVVKSLGINLNYSEDMIDNALASHLNECLIFTTGLVKGSLEVNGFHFIQEPKK